MDLSRYVYRIIKQKYNAFIFKTLGCAYELDAFIKSCPSNQEIILHWIRRETSSKEYLQLTKEEPKFSFDLPNKLR
jgi:hypothetical protein